MPIALVLDFPGGTREKYDQVVARMELGGHLAPGGITHAAGHFEDGWRVIDVWESLETFERFRDEQVIPHVQAVGLSMPRVQLLQVENEMPDNGRAPGFIQYVRLPGLDRERFRAVDDEVLKDTPRPDGLTWHVNGPLDGGWYVIDGWTSKEIRDSFMARTGEILGRAPLSGPPMIEELLVEATMPAAAHVTG